LTNTAAAAHTPHAQDPSVRAALKHARRSGKTAAVLQTKEQRALQLLQRELQDHPATQQLVGCLAAAGKQRWQQEQRQEHGRPLVMQQHAARQEAPRKQQHQAAATPTQQQAAPALARR
jgi:hypothetical protein